MSEISKLEQNLIIKKIDNETVNISINNNDMLNNALVAFEPDLLVIDYSIHKSFSSS